MDKNKRINKLMDENVNFGIDWSGGWNVDGKSWKH